MRARRPHRRSQLGFGLLLLALTALLGSPVSAGELSLSDIFSDHAVLQRDRPVPVWGRAAPGAAVEVRFAGRSVRTIAGPDGRWRADLPAMQASFEPRILSVRSGGEAVEARDIVVGEVWFMAGQSNMEWRLVNSDDGRRTVAEADIPTIRLMVAEANCAAEPREEVRPIWRSHGERDAWQTTRPWSANRVGGVPFHFATELRRELKVPVGIIQAAVGGTRIESWTPEAALRANPAFAREAAWLDTAQARHRAEEQAALAAHRAWLAAVARLPTGAAVPDPPAWPSNPESWFNQPTCFYNGMVHPLTPYAIAGMGWYQGESNVPEGERYGERLTAFLAAMRQAWRRPDLPVAVVQLAPYAHPTSNKLPLVWEAQLKAARAPNTGLVVLSDLVPDVTDLHPTNKRDVGRRLARWAMSAVYGRRDLTPTGPLYRRHAVEGGRVRIAFDHARGLATTLGQPVSGFEVAGADRRFRPAVATIEDESVVVASSDVPAPVAVRFAWSPTARPNLINDARLPAASFRTDDWATE
jgi:sialate O-acetylesterase